MSFSCLLLGMPFRFAQKTGYRANSLSAATRAR